MIGAIGVLNRLQAKFGKESLRETLGGTVTTMSITAVGAVVSFLMFSLSARRLGPEEFGMFSTWFSAASFLAVFAGLGQETLIVRTWAEYVSSRRFGLARGAFLFGLVVTLVGSLAVAAGVLLVQPLLNIQFGFACVAAAFIVTQALMHFGTNSSHNIVGYFVGQGSADVTWRLLVLIAITLPFVSGDFWTAQALLLAIAAAQICLFIIQMTAVYLVAPQEVHDAKVEAKSGEWRDRGLRMWAGAIVEASSQYVDVIVVSMLTDTVTAGAYFAVTRVANIFGRVSNAMASFARRKIAPLYFSDRMDELKSLTRSLAMITLAVVAGGLVVIILFGHLLLGLFGPRFAAEMPALVILALGTAVIALSGPAPSLLQSTGNEGIYARIIAYAFVARTVLMVVLVPLLNTQGAALAWTIVALGTAWALNVACRHRVGIDPSPRALL